MRRREFIAGLGSAAVWPVVGRAQEHERVRRIGVLLPAAADDANFRPASERSWQALGRNSTTIRGD